MANLYDKFYKKIQKYQKNFEYMLDTIDKTNSIELKLKLGEVALKYAVNSNTGYFTSSKLETLYTDYAKTIDIPDYNIEYKPNSFLHVLTMGYKTGGHTRVVERWIKNAPLNEFHNVVILNKTDKFEVLEKNTKDKNGECFYFSNELSLKEKALKLRELAMHFEFIILHTHMEDPIATVAFGTEKFTRPVIFYNHADHLFWIGKSISDLTLDLIENAEITKERRNIDKTFYMGIPTDIHIKETTKSKDEYRKELGLPLNKRIIMSSGIINKFNPIGGG